MEKLRVGVLSTGNIAATMAETLRCMEDVELYAVASRCQEKADAFAEKYGFEKAFSTYEEMAADEKVDLVYVATPISEHCSHVKMLLENGRNVLCEKAFAVNAREAEEMTALSKRKGTASGRGHVGQIYAHGKDTAGGTCLRCHRHTVYPDR